MATATTEALAGLQTIPLDRITPNPFNPRKHFEKAPLAELAESIKVHGVRQPVLVRPLGKNFQLVVGERRWRASKLAGKENIPAIVDPQLDDRSALEIMVIENLQREDVHPLDEALGYQVLMEQVCSECKSSKGHKLDCPRRGEVQTDVTVESIAAKVGKSVGYVYARMKLLALVTAAREAFQKGHITAGHSVLIARLQPFDQLRALAACFKTYVTKDEESALKKLDAKTLKWGEFAEALALPIDPEGAKDDIELGPSEELRLASEKYLREWIQDNVNLRLKGVPWDLNDAKLYPEAGACATCQKRSASNPALFAELAKGEDTCFDAACYGKKREAFVKITIKADKKRAADENATRFVESVGPHEDSGKYDKAQPLRQISEQTAYTAPKPDQRVLKQGQWLPAKTKKECDSVEEALIVNGENAGVRRLVCCNGKCKVHQHHFQQPLRGSPSEDPKGAAAREMKRRVDDQLQVEILKATMKQLKKPDAKTILGLAELANDCIYGGDELALAVLGLKSGKELDAFRKKANLQQAMGLLFLGIMGDNDYIDSRPMKMAIKLSKADVPKLRKDLEKKEAAKVQTPAKPAAATAKKGKA